MQRMLLVPFPTSTNLLSTPSSKGQKALRVWIDAICINQSDHEERSGQVSIMGDVFHSARRTVVYLGELDDGTWYSKRAAGPRPPRELALRAVAEMHRVRHLIPADWAPGRRRLNVPLLPQAFVSPEFFYIWYHLFALPWFDRAWVVQEVVLAQEVMSLLGHVRIDWRTMEIAASMPHEALRSAHASGGTLLRDLPLLRGFEFAKPLIFQPLRNS